MFDKIAIIIAVASVIIIIVAELLARNTIKRREERLAKHQRIEDDRRARRLENLRGEIGNKIATALCAALKGTNLQININKDNASCYYIDVGTSTGSIFQVSVGVHVVDGVATFGLYLHEGAYGKSAYFLPNEGSVEWLIEYLVQRIRTR
jgi:hypothetical protein